MTAQTRTLKPSFTKKDEAKERLLYTATLTPDEALDLYHSSWKGMNINQVEAARQKYGANVVEQKKKDTVLKRFVSAFVNPFTGILVVLAIVSAFTDIVFADPANRSYSTVIIITIMVLFSGILRFVQETRSSNAADALAGMIKTTTCVSREPSGKEEVELSDVVVGDVIYLSAGDMIPADCRILSAKDLFISQSALTGESAPVEKSGAACSDQQALTEIGDLAFMGSNVQSGSGIALAAAVGPDTMLGSMSKELNAKPEKTAFEKGINSVSWVLIRFMLVMVPIVFLLNGLTKGNWLSAFLFAISIAVGLTPEMLPMIETTNLARGAVAMSKKKVIIKNLNSIQNLGSMDILCTDKTGTLTQDQVQLQKYLNIDGQEDPRVLRHAYLISAFQTGLKNLMDQAVIAAEDEQARKEIEKTYYKTDEIPFDFSRRRMSVIVQDKEGKIQMITKGAIEEMIKVCSYAEMDGQVLELSEERCHQILETSNALNEQGMRVLGVAQKTSPDKRTGFGPDDENEMVLIGFLAFLDPPKETTASAIQALHSYGVDVKILTGDNEKVTRSICQQVGLPVKEILMGSEMDDLSDKELKKKAEHITVFAKLSPDQKARIVKVLRDDGHCVGYMGDGINDALAMKSSDVGISVDTAVDIARESASVILLEKDLNVLENGVIEGRKTYANMIKYIKMTASSNFGNMFSELFAAAFLPFLPMAALHLILLNLINDVVCTAIPWDNVDEDFLKKPRTWDASGISKFMLWMGPTSSVFDILTFLLLFFIICPMFTGGTLYGALSDPTMQLTYVAVFQAGWFVESMVTQTLVMHMIRTEKIPFIQSRSSASLMALSIGAIVLVSVLPFTPVGTMIGFHALPLVYFAFLAAIAIAYLLLASAIKHVYIKKYGTLL